MLGSKMTNFALTIWVWQQTQMVRAITLIAFFSEVPILAIALFAGVWVDRSNRKHIMMLGDAIAALSSLAILVLFLSGQLALWQLYLTGAIAGIFGYLQGLAFSASQALLVSKQQYVRMGALGSIKTFGTGVLAPAFAGILYPFIGLTGILILDLVTFAIAISALCLVQIPQPASRGVGSGEWGVDGVSIQAMWQELTIGFRYLWHRPSLFALQLFAMSFIFFDTASAVMEPMLLARSGNNTVILGSVTGAVGLGGLIGGIGLSFWGGPKRRIHGLLIGRGIIFGFESLLGLARSPAIWIGANFCAGLLKPLANSCEDAIWMSKVDPQVQGRVFSASSFLTSLTAPLGFLLAGPLADRVFEPAMQPGGSLVPLFGEIFGTGTGSGMALQFTLCSLIVVLICFGSYAFPVLRDIETQLPDHDVAT